MAGKKPSKHTSKDMRLKRNQKYREEMRKIKPHLK